MFDTEPGGIEAAAELVDYLSTRLGTNAVTKARLAPDFQPEYACCFEPLIQAKTQPQPARAKAGDNRRARRERGPAAPPYRPMRPLRLMPRPVDIEVVSAVPDGPPYQMRWEGGSSSASPAHADGPEGIEDRLVARRDVRQITTLWTPTRDTPLDLPSEGGWEWFLHMLRLREWRFRRFKGI